MKCKVFVLFGESWLAITVSLLPTPVLMGKKQFTRNRTNIRFKKKIESRPKYRVQSKKCTLAKKEMNKADKELPLLLLDLRNLFMFIAHVSSICFSASVLTPECNN